MYDGYPNKEITLKLLNNKFSKKVSQYKDLDSYCDAKTKSLLDIDLDTWLDSIKKLK